MDDHKLEHQIDKLKKDYERLPSFSDDQDILRTIERESKKSPKFHWVKYVGSLAAVAFISVILTLSFLKDEQQAGSMESYYLDQKEAFVESIGFSEVDQMYAVKEAQDIAVDYDAGKSQLDEAEAKERINELLSTPQQMYLDLEEQLMTLTPEEREARILEIVDKQAKFASIMVNYWGEYANQLNDIDEDNQEMWIARLNSGTLKEYPEIQEAAEKVFQQGYKFVEGPVISVKVDYTWTFPSAEDFISDELRNYLELKNVVQPLTSPPSMQEWKSYPERMRQIEEHLELFPNSKYKGELLNILTFIAKQYLLVDFYSYSTFVKNEQVIPEVYREYERFLSQNTDSKLWGVVKLFYLELQSENWMINQVELDVEGKIKEFIGIDNNGDPMPGEMPDDFAFSVAFGVGSKNRVDTFNNRVTKDLISDGTVTIDLELSEEEMTEIYQLMRDINIMNIGQLIPKSDCRLEPHDTDIWRIQVNGEIQEFTWTNQYCELTKDAQELLDLRNQIYFIVKAKDEYKALPEATGGYK